MHVCVWVPVCACGNETLLVFELPRLRFFTSLATRALTSCRPGTASHRRAWPGQIPPMPTLKEIQEARERRTERNLASHGITRGDSATPASATPSSPSSSVIFGLGIVGMAAGYAAARLPLPQPHGRSWTRALPEPQCRVPSRAAGCGDLLARLSPEGRGILRDEVARAVARSVAIRSDR